jgi:uncharacterized cupredoxin-like copper-binding protein
MAGDRAAARRAKHLIPAFISLETSQMQSAASVPRVARSPLIQPDKTATFAVTFTKKGEYRYLCTVPGHAALGMRGVFAVR